ncbi:MAG: hypothetical protein ABJB03_02085 [Rhodoglobus sp.]
MAVNEGQTIRRRTWIVGLVAAAVLLLGGVITYLVVMNPGVLVIAVALAAASVLVAALAVRRAS